MSPLIITATGSDTLSNVTLWYRNSTNNQTWNYTDYGITWQLSDSHYDGDGFFNNINYINKAIVKNAYTYQTITPSNTILAYCATRYDNCLTIINCTNQWVLTELSSFVISGSPHDIYIMDYPVIGRVAFILTYTSGNLLAINVTNPNNISVLDSLDVITSKGMYIDVDETHKILYEIEFNSAGPDYLHAIDIKNPRALNKICSIITKRDKPWTPHINDNNCNYLYLTGDGATAPYNSSVSIYNTTYVHNISNPTITYIKTQGYGSYADLIQEGYFLYASAQYTYHHPPQNYSLHIWNISDPKNLTNVSITPLNTYNHFCLWNAPTRTYLFTRFYTTDIGDYGVNIVDVHNKNNPMNIGYIPHIPNVQKLNRCHWMQLHYNNITQNYVLYVVGYYEDSWISFNITLNTTFSGWKKFSTDTIYPWSWNFTFLNGSGYYEFYSIGKKFGSSDEEPPASRDALCHYIRPPNTPQKPSGEINGNIGTEYTYNTTTTDPDNTSLFYLWSWGDANVSGWYGPFGSNDVASASHIWTKRGTYEIKVKAKNENGAESNWSEPLSATMPFSYHDVNMHFFERLFERLPHAFPILRRLIEYVKTILFNISAK